MRSIRIIYVLIGATIVLIVANSIFFLNQFHYNQKSYTNSKNAYRTIEYINTLQNTLVSAQASQRGYYITGDTIYLRPYNIAIKDIEATYKKLYSLEYEHSKQLPKLEQLNRLINLKLAALTRAIEYQRSGNKEQAYQLFLSDNGIELSQKIQRLIRQVKNEELSYLESNNAYIDRSSLRIQLFSIISNWVLLIVILSALINIIRNRQQISNLFNQIGKKNDLLESQKNELQYMSKDLIKQNTELERFAYVASHDLRSPALNQIALIDLFKVAKSDEERDFLLKNMSEVAHNLAVKLDDMIEALRSKHDSNELHETLKFEDVYDTVAAGLMADIRESSAHIDCDFSEAEQIYFPKSYLESIIQNLLSNAIKYRHPDRPLEIKLKTYRSDKQTCFKISDNGLGIDLNKNGQNIFGLYKTFHKDHDSKGLGLYITKAQVLAMGGTIDVNSTPNVGTTFTICV